jgi:hypothetical protein
MEKESPMQIVSPRSPTGSPRKMMQVVSPGSPNSVSGSPRKLMQVESPRSPTASPRKMPGSPKSGSGSPRKMQVESPRSPTSSPKKMQVEFSKVMDSPMADSEKTPRGEAARRSRKSVDRFVGSSPVIVKTKNNVEPRGSGIPLGEISKIAEKLYKVAVKDDALKRLHRILFGSDGTSTTRKKEIRTWNGTSSDATKKQMQTGLAGAKSVAMLKDICGILNLATGGDRSNLETRIFDFLVKPTGSTAPIAAKKKSKSKISKKVSTKKPSSGSSSFSAFMKKRLPEIKAQAGGSMNAKDITELLTMEWARMTKDEKEEYSVPSGKVEKVKKIITKKPVSEEESSSSSSGESDSSEDSSSSSSSEND